MPIYPKVFSCEHTPRTPLADAVRISKSIPLFFSAVKSVRGDIYVNGGVLLMYIDTLGVKTTQFDLDDKTKEALVESGRVNTFAYFTWYDELKNKVVNRPGE